jgi:hypothetical protein
MPKRHVMKAYGERVNKVPFILIPRNGRSWRVKISLQSLDQTGQSPVVHWMRGQMGPRAGPDVYGSEGNPCLAVNRAPIFQSIANHINVWASIYIYNNLRFSVRLSHTVSPQQCVIKELVETKYKYVPLGETTQGKLLIFLLRAWVRVQASKQAVAYCWHSPAWLFLFLRKKGIWILTIMGPWQQWDREKWYINIACFIETMVMRWH